MVINGLARHLNSSSTTNWFSASWRKLSLIDIVLIESFHCSASLFHSCVDIVNKTLS